MASKLIGRMKSQIILFLLISFTFSCKNDKEERNYTCTQDHEASACGAVMGKVNIRFFNNTRLQICNLLYKPVITNQGYYLTLASYGKTCYLPYDSSYSYGPLTYDLGGIKGSLLPIDYVGETLLGPGNYTLELIEQQNAVSNKIYIGKLQKD
ncbi:MAG: hypothetical protein CFE21_03025 [Bacteroidetes bacterium B1(2017)]|nr:MAG: hypothetical protein CFE21_03025 [Bacteroidetes bacterium B1(2017)]